MIKRKYTPTGLKAAMEKDITKRGVKYDKLDLPVVGMRLPKKTVARRLMNQRATSVADVAAVLKKHVTPRSSNPEILTALTPTQLLVRNEKKREFRKQALSSRAFNRLEKIEQTQAEKTQEIEDRQKYVTPRTGYTSLQKHTVNRLSMEYEGTVHVPQKGMVLNVIEDARIASEEEFNPKRALEVASRQFEEEKEMQRTIIEKQLSAQIDQRLADMSESERTQIQQEIAEERTRKEAKLNEAIAQAEADLRTRLELEHNRIGTPSGPKSSAQYRRIKRQLTAQIDRMKTSREEQLKWLGPYAEINRRINGVLGEINHRKNKTIPPLAEALYSFEARIKNRRDKTNTDNDEADAEINETNTTSGHEVEIRWADLRDGTYAREWPDSVFHSGLESRAVVKAPKSVIREHAHLDEMEYEISQQSRPEEITLSTSIHVFGAEDKGDPAEARWQSPEHLEEKSTETRRERVLKWAQTETILIRRRINALRRENKFLTTIFSDSPLDRDNMPQLAAILDRFDNAMNLRQYLQPETFTQKDIEETEYWLTSATEKTLLDAAREEVTNSRSPDADRARLQWVIGSAEAMKLECKYPEAKFQADSRENYLDKFDERIRLLIDIANDKSGADARLQQFDDSYSLARDVMQRYQADPPTMNEVFIDVEQTRIAQQEVLRKRESTEKDARAALFEIEARHPSIDGQDPEVVMEAKGELQAAVAELNAARQIIADTKEERMRVIEQVNQKMKAVRDDEDGWKEFKDRKGESDFLLNRERRASLTNGRLEDQDVVIPEQQKSVWGRVKGLFGRS